MPTASKFSSASATSRFPSPLKSPTAAQGEVVELGRSNGTASNTTPGTANVTVKNAGFDRPAPGLFTVTEAVPAVAMFAAGTVAVSCELLTKVVVSGMPFQLTVAPETKPVPLTVSVKSGPPGATAEGTSG